MNSNQLLLIIILCFAVNIASAADQSGLITIEHKISPETIYVKDSADPDISTVTIKIIGNDSAPRKNVSAVLVIDASNSMIGSHLAAAKSASKKFIAGLDNSTDKIGFVSFNNTTGPNIKLENNFSRLNITIDAVNITKNVNGSTCLSAGLKEAIEILRPEKNDSLKAIIFLSDGDNTTCQKNDNPCSDAAEARKLGIIIFTVGINDSGKGTNYLKCMAETTGGSYYHAETNELEKIYENLSKNIPNIIAKDVLLNYETSDGIEINNVSRWFARKNKEPNSLYGSAGTISANETKIISFDVSARKAGWYDLATGNNSKITFTGYDGESHSSKLSMITIEVLDKPEENAGSIPFQFQVQGSEIARRDLNTNMTISKSITGGTSGPHITLELTAPGIEAIKTGVVIAVDSSGSLGMGGRAEYGENIRQSIPKILERIEEKMPVSNVSIISWDDDVDFAYDPIENHNPANTRMVPISKAKEEIEKMKVFGSSPNWIDKIIGYFFPGTLSPESGYYYCDELESTNLSIGLESARIVLNRTAQNEFDATRKLILFIVARSEFSECNDTLIYKAISENCDIHTVGVGVIDGSKLQDELIKIAGNENKYHYSPGSTLWNSAVVAEAIDKALQQFYKENISNNIVITETLYPYLRIDNKSIQVTMNGSVLRKDLINVMVETNPDDTTTLDIVFDKNLSMKPNDILQVSFDTYLDLSLPVDAISSRRSRTFFIDPNTPVSFVSYKWLGNNYVYNIPLPESNLNI